MQDSCGSGTDIAHLQAELAQAGDEIQRERAAAVAAAAEAVSAPQQSSDAQAPAPPLLRLWPSLHPCACCRYASEQLLFVRSA